MRKLTISPKRAALLLNKSIPSIYGILQYNALPIGAAWKNPGSSKWSYEISAHKIAEHLGISVEEVIGEGDGEYDD